MNKKRRHPLVLAVFTALAGLAVAGAVAAQTDTPPSEKIENWPVPVTAWPPAIRAASAAEAALPTEPLPFIGLTPCRLVDTRRTDLPTGYGRPAMTAGSTRTFRATGRPHCQIPTAARAVSINVTVVRPTSVGYFSIFPSGLATPPTVATLNFQKDTNIANAAIVPLGDDGGLTGLIAFADADVVIDVNGYFGGSLPSSWKLNGAVVYYNDGSVGIGTSTPPNPGNPADQFVKLDIEDGNIQIDAERGLVTEGGAKVVTGPGGGTFRFIAGSGLNDIAYFMDSTGAKKVAIDKAGGIQFGAQKVCSILVGNTWRDNLLVPSTWTAATCDRLRSNLGASAYQLGCIFENDFSIGRGSGIPTPNCGW